MGEQRVKIRSTDVTEGFRRAPARAMLRAVGMTDDDWDKPQIGVASSWNEVTPCNLPLDRLAKRSKEGVRDAGGFPLEFTTIAVSDGISMGHEGMRGSLVSREIIADSVECVMHSRAARRHGHVRGLRQVAARHVDGGGAAQPADGVRLRRLDPAGRAQRAAPSTSRRCSRRSVRCATGAITEEELGQIERKACPSEGSCAGMFTANTMAAVAEALGMSLPGSASAPAPDRRRDDFAYRSGQAVVELLRRNIRPRNILTKEAFENAIAVVNALGGSTNAVLHLLAIAHEAGVELELEDFNRVAARVPHIADMKPRRQVPHDRPRPHRRRARRVEAPARRGPAARRLPHRHRQDRRREPRGARSARARRCGGASARATRSTSRAASSCCAARSPPRGRWSRSQV